MISEKIQNLMKEVQKECDKEGVSSVCTLNKKGHVAVMITGGLKDIAFCLGAQERELDKQLPIPTKILRSAAVNSINNTNEKDQQHTYIIDDLDEIPNILSRILKGEM